MRIASMCLRNLFRRRTRTSLCILGIAMGIMLIIAIGATTTRYVTVLKDMNEFYRGTVVVVPKGSIFIQAISLGGYLQERVLDSLLHIGGVRYAIPIIVILSFADHENVIQLVPSNITVGLPAGNWSTLTGSLTLQPGGRWPSASLEEKEVVIGPAIATKYGLHLDDEIECNHQILTVTGILNAPASSSLLGASLIMTLTTAQEVYGYPQLISMVIVVPEDGITEQELSDHIDAEIPGVDSLTGDERNNVVAPILRDLELWSLGICSAISGINSILVLVVSMMTVFERRRELATFDALGIPFWSIIRVIMVETGLTGLLGWALGVPLGILTALLIVYWYTFGSLSLILSNVFLLISPVMVLETLIITLILSSGAGFISAITLVRKNTAALLRSDY